MGCDHPIKAYYSKDRNENGKRGLVFNPIKGLGDKPLEIPCQKCTGCRLRKSQEWATRCMHEAQMHEENTYLTLTYDEKNLPDGETLIPRDLQLYHKRLNNRLLRLRQRGIRYFACGEYGEENNRPHYHTIIFGYDYKDKKFYKYNKQGQPLYTSEKLEEEWGLGQCTIGAATYESAGYVARYTLKKINGDPAADHYQGREPEFGRMSRRPGVGSAWYEQYGEQTRNHDNVMTSGRLVRPPKYYDKLTEKHATQCHTPKPNRLVDNNEYDKLKGKRQRRARRKEITNLDQRQRQRDITAKVRDSRMAIYKREL